ncbi:EAF3 Chromatin modification-related protein EAF3 [Candida maltosa Xu316]
MYEARILKRKKTHESFILNHDQQKETIEENEPKFDKSKWKNQTSYFLHYQGWNHKWDEWVGIDRILEINEENEFKKLQLVKLSAIKKKPKKKKPLPTTPTTTVKSTTSKKPSQSINMNFPPELKIVLVNDWESVTKDKKLVTVPTKIPVHEILKSYQDYRNLETRQDGKLHEILNGLEIFFTQSLSRCLLYQYERPQYLDLVKKSVINAHTSVSHIYGVEHLLRLLVSMPSMISDTTMDGISTSVLISELEGLCGFLAENIAIYQNDYENQIYKNY